MGSSPLSIFFKLFHIRNLPKSGNVVLLRSCCLCGVVVCPILEPLRFFFVNVLFVIFQHNLCWVQCMSSNASLMPGFLMKKIIFFCHLCTASCTSLDRKLFPPRASLSGPKIWKSREYCGWGLHSKWMPLFVSALTHEVVVTQPCHAATRHRY
jgi:hypothetical protein